MSMQSTQQTTNRHTITAMFDSRADAATAVEELVKAGVPRTSVRMTPESDVATTTTTTSYDTSRDEKGFFASLGDMFMPDEDRTVHAEAMHRGHIMVAVMVDQAHAAIAEDILEQHGTVDLEEQEASWRKTGWSGAPAATAPALGATAATTASIAGSTATPKRTGTAALDAKDDVISVYEEQLNVGKRQVSAGRVKIRSYVVETPVTEQVSLRSEEVHVERRPVDRAVTAGEDAFRDRTIEATATSEEAVIQKNLRVKEEIGLRKVAEQQTKTVSDTVRHTEVEVEDDRVDTRVGAKAVDPKSPTIKTTPER